MSAAATFFIGLGIGGMMLALAFAVNESFIVSQLVLAPSACTFGYGIGLATR